VVSKLTLNHLTRGRFLIAVFFEIAEGTETAKNFPVPFYYTTVLAVSLPLKSENKRTSS
jgi:hypothetical protein